MEQKFNLNDLKDSVNEIEQQEIPQNQLPVRPPPQPSNRGQQEYHHSYRPPINHQDQYNLPPQRSYYNQPQHYDRRPSAEQYDRRSSIQTSNLNSDIRHKDLRQRSTYEEQITPNTQSSGSNQGDFRDIRSPIIQSAGSSNLQSAGSSNIQSAGVNQGDIKGKSPIIQSAGSSNLQSAGVNQGDIKGNIQFDTVDGGNRLGVDRRPVLSSNIKSTNINDAPVPIKNSGEIVPAEYTREGHARYSGEQGHAAPARYSGEQGYTAPPARYSGEQGHAAPARYSGEQGYTAPPARYSGEQGHAAAARYSGEQGYTAPPARYSGEQGAALRPSPNPHRPRSRSPNNQYVEPGNLAYRIPSYEPGFAPPTHLIHNQNYDSMSYQYPQHRMVWPSNDSGSVYSGVSNHQQQRMIPPQNYNSMPNQQQRVMQRPQNHSRNQDDTASVYSTNSNNVREVLIPHENLEQYRQDVKKSNDPAQQFAFAKQLILVAEEMRKNPLGLDPTKVRKNREILHSEAIRWIKKAATGTYKGKTGLPDALFFLADCFGNGNLGLTIDHDKAFGYYVQGAKHDHPASIYRTGVCYEVGAGPRKDYSRAVQYYKKAAALGDTAAMYKIGIILLGGSLGQTRNPREGVTYLKRAANQADETTPFALHELAILYEGVNSDPSIGVVPDPSYAYELYLKSAKLGYASSQYKLGLSFEYGHMGLPLDPARSIGWYTKAAEQGDPDSELALSGWYLTGCDPILARNENEAFLWAQKASEKGLAKAEYAVAYFMENGIGTRVDLVEARRWYVRAASQGNERAIARLKNNQSHAHPKPSQWRHEKAAQDGNCTVM